MRKNYITYEALELGKEFVPSLNPGAIFKLEIPLPSIGSTNNPIDIASDYAWALHAAQLLAPHVTKFSHQFGSAGYRQVEVFTFTVVNVDRCLNAIRDIAFLFSDSDDEGEDARTAAILFEHSLLDYPKICFPDLGDSFLANYVHGLEATFDEDEIERLYEMFPTWRFHFWKSFLSQNFDGDLYVSTDSWILPRSVDPSRFLRELQGRSSQIPRFFNASPVRTNSLPWILVAEPVCVVVPLDYLRSSATCWFSVFASNGSRRKSASKPPKNLSSHRLLEIPNNSWSISGDASIVTLSVEDFTLLTFIGPECKLRPDVIERYARDAEQTCSALSQHCGLPADSPCQWSLLNDEQFEQLCYDILLRCERFDPRKIRKLGKARSRDGGRDIEVWTIPKPGEASQKWIYQCKFSARGGRSLSGSEVAVSDIVDQYDADGFGILTNRIIDATLYDKVDAIAANRSKRGAKLEVDCWSINEIESFLFPCKDLIRRHFKQR